jgi:hypothetical protein
MSEAGLVAASFGRQASHFRTNRRPVPELPEISGA